MQTRSRKTFKEARTLNGKRRHQNAYDVAKLKSSGIFDSSKRGRLKVHRILDMSEQEKLDFGVLTVHPVSVG